MLKIPPPGGGAPEHRGGQGRLPHLCHHVPRVRMQRTLRRGSGHIQYVRARQNQHQGMWNKVSMCMCNAGYVVDLATFSMYVRSRTSIKVRRGSRTQCLIGQWLCVSWLMSHKDMSWSHESCAMISEKNVIKGTWGSKSISSQKLCDKVIKNK